MRKIFFVLFTVLCGIVVNANGYQTIKYGKYDSMIVNGLEKWSYTENFEDRDLGAWASYPHWQDIAYDQNFRVNEIVPGDPNISIVQLVTPYSNVDNYAGAQKLLDMYLVPGAKVKFRYYLKTNIPVEYFKVRFAAGDYGKLDVTIPHPESNRWVWATVDFNDFVRENAQIAGKSKVPIHALAFLTKIPNADPNMPIYLGLDDISFEGARAAAFQFASPAVYKLPEFAPYIPKKHFVKGDVFNLSGSWPVQAKKVTLEIVSYTNEQKKVFEGELSKNGEVWSLKPLKLSFDNGLYLGKLTALDGSKIVSGTSFTIHLAPDNIAGKHPRLLFDAGRKKLIDERFKEPRFQTVHANILKNAKLQREKVRVDSLIFDLDQFPDEDWLPTWSAWGNHIYHTAEALRSNAMAYAFHNDKEAGVYAKDILVKLAGWPNWTHPWQTKRGRFSEHRTGSWSHRVAEAYDLTYDLMTEEERIKIRKAILDNIIAGAHRTYVHNDNITGKTSNWIAMTVGGSLMNMAAIFGDGPDTENLEPYFTGAMLKYYTFINRVTDSKDGAWGEGLGYNNYSFSNMSYSIPSLYNVFNIDVTEPLVGTYNEYIWGGLIKSRLWFEFGDSGGELGPATNWAYLLNMRKEPRLGWYYNFMKKGETFEDVLYDTKNVKEDSPFDENPVKVFKEVGTTVFKGGWEKDDFSFVMRTGPFFNHQHLDQGSFWLADKGVVFIEERHLHNSNYYDDPLYQRRLIQPIGHSTILVNNNHQSQRVGDHLKFAPGFNDHAFIAQFLDGKSASFSRGDIGKLYWGQVASLSRNVLFIKPGTLLMIDEAVPDKKDADITLLYQTARLKDIHAGQSASTITKEGVSLNIVHLAPHSMAANAVETPHYLKTLQNVKPLEREGMLTLTARTSGSPLVMANMLTTTAAGVAPEIKTDTGEGFIRGTVSGKKFAFTTRPGILYQVDDMKTDALSMTWDDQSIFVAMATVFRRDGSTIIQSAEPITFEISGDSIKYYSGKRDKLVIAAGKKPSSVTLNGKPLNNFNYDDSKKTITVEVPEGEGLIIVKW
jgi:hypothetical protein